MGNNKIKGLCILLLLTMMGCDKFLDKEPENKVSVDILFSDVQGAVVALNGVYANMWSNGYYNGARMVYPEVAGGNVKPISTTAQSFNEVYTFTASADNGSMNSFYSSGYAMLSNLNTIIARVPLIVDGSPLKQNNMLAHAYALRALLQFDLLLLYAQDYAYTPDASHPGIILVTSPLPVTEAMKRRRNSVAEVYAQIDADLTMAEQLFVNGQSVFTGGTASSRFSTAAVQALKARLYLHQGLWQQAYDYSTRVIDNAAALYSTSEYVTAWKTSGGRETILELTPPSNYTSKSLGNYYVNDTANNDYQFAPTQDLLSLFSVGDIRAEGGVFKYPTYGAEATSVKLIRLSEMYLIRAEAAAELGQYQLAIADLNTIRLRANPDLDEWAYTDKAALIDEILDERRRELCLEGFQLFDLTRRHRPLVRTDCEGDHCHLDYPSDQFVQPIPRQSVDTNPNMEQNPGY